MDAASSIYIIKALANGIDPHTGEEYSADSPYQHPQTIRALFTAIAAMEIARKSEDRLRNLPGNAGKAWEAEEDRLLLAAFDAGKSVKQIAEEHGRTELAINARLVRHGTIQK